MNIYFARHGESVANLTWEFSNHLGKHGLTPKGVSQAKDLAQQFDRSKRWKIYSSPILRAQETAIIVARHLDCEVEPVDALREYDVGILEGRSDTEAWDIYWKVAADWIEREEYDSRIEGGESFNDIQIRFLPFIEVLKESFEENVICISHGGTLNLMLPLVLANVSKAFVWQNRLNNTATVVVEKRESNLIALKWAAVDLTS